VEPIRTRLADSGGTRPPALFTVGEHVYHLRHPGPEGLAWLIRRAMADRLDPATRNAPVRIVFAACLDRAARHRLWARLGDPDDPLGEDDLIGPVIDALALWWGLDPF